MAGKNTLLAVLALAALAGCVGNRTGGNVTGCTGEGCIAGNSQTEASTLPGIGTSSPTVSTGASPPTPPTSSTAQTANFCNFSAQCPPERNLSVYCDGSLIRRLLERYSCRGGGCVGADSVEPVFDCAPGICFRGECYEETCANGALDYNELDVDCGGVCPSCEERINRTCRRNADCGSDHTLPGFRCSEGGIVQDKEHFACEAGRCFSNVSSGLYKQCLGRFGCFTGENDCAAKPKTCGNCKRDGGEEHTDCGGPCWPCAPKPENATKYLDYRRLFINGAYNAVRYKEYEISYLGPWNTENDEVNCSYGGLFRVRAPNLTSADLTVTRYRNGGFGGIVVGFEWAGYNSAQIWVAG